MRWPAGILTCIKTGFRETYKPLLMGSSLRFAPEPAVVIRHSGPLITIIRQKHKQKQSAWNENENEANSKPEEELPKRFDSPEEEFAALSEEYPQLQEYDPATILSFMEFMTNYGFNSNKSVEMVIRLPSILTTYVSQVPRATDAWRSLGLDEKQMTRLLFRHPQLIDYPINKTKSRYTLLNTFLTRKEALEAIISSVQVILDSEPAVERKLNYLLKRVCHKAPAIVKSKVMSYSFLHIRTRHEFLIRAGLFGPVSYHKLHKQAFANDASAIRDKYYSPSDVVCTHDKEFIRKCTGGMLSINELACFEEIFKREVQKDDDLPLDDHGTKSGRSDYDVDEDDAINSSSSSSEYFNAKDSAEFYY